MLEQGEMDKTSNRVEYLDTLLPTRDRPEGRSLVKTLNNATNMPCALHPAVSAGALLKNKTPNEKCQVLQTGQLKSPQKTKQHRHVCLGCNNTPSPTLLGLLAGN